MDHFTLSNSKTHVTCIWFNNYEVCLASSENITYLCHVISIATSSRIRLRNFCKIFGKFSNVSENNTSGPGALVRPLKKRSEYVVDLNFIDAIMSRKEFHDDANLP